MDLAEAVISDHATRQMNRRGIAESDVRQVLKAPEAVLPDRPGRVVAQGMVDGHLLRVFVDIDRVPAQVVTAYRTSKIQKYRSRP
jgi:hypothetical protein